MAKSFDELVARTTTKQTREKAAKRTRELLSELLLSEVRQQTGQSQQQVADTLGMKQPSLSKLETKADMQISTLREIVQALGGELDVLARFPQGRSGWRNLPARRSAKTPRLRPAYIIGASCATLGSKTASQNMASLLFQS